LMAFCVSVCGTGVWTQGLILARQTILLLELLCQSPWWCS
jgi:hypothetical protein